MQVTRQAGSFYMWARYYEYSADSRQHEPIRRGLAALGARSLPISKSRVQEWVEATRILSLPILRWKLQRALRRFGLLYRPAGSAKVVSPDGGYVIAQAGATAVALLAELSFSRASGDNQFAHLRSAWFGGLLSLRIPGAGFKQTPDSLDESDFSNGEAWLAIAMYCERYPDEKCATVLSDLDGVMLNRYSRRPTTAFYHWGATAAAQRFNATRELRFVKFLEQQATFFLKYAQRLNPDDNNCAGMEGVAATLSALRQAGEENGALAIELRTWLSKEADKLSRLQIQAGQKTLRLGGDAHLVAPRLSEFSGAFLMGLYDPSTRVDAAAHCLSAMIMIERGALLR